MLPRRHCAYDITTGEILCCDRGNHLKRSVALTKRVNKEMPDSGVSATILARSGLRKERLPDEELPVL